MFDKLHGGEMYLPMDKEIMKVQLACMEKLYEFSQKGILK